VGWRLIWLAEAPIAPSGGDSEAVTVALIAALGTVLVALISWAGSRGARTSPSPPVPDPQLGDRLKVVEIHDEDDRRTLAQLDKHVDGIGDRVERIRWDLDHVMKRLDRLIEQLDPDGGP